MITFRDADERIAWDRFVAGCLAGDIGPVGYYSISDIATSDADALIEERRSREPEGGIMNYAVDETKAGPR